MYAPNHRDSEYIWTPKAWRASCLVNALMCQVGVRSWLRRDKSWKLLILDPFTLCPMHLFSLAVPELHPLQENCISKFWVILGNYWTWRVHRNPWVYSQSVRSAGDPGLVASISSDHWTLKPVESDPNSGEVSVRIEVQYIEVGWKQGRRHMVCSPRWIIAESKNKS